MLFGLVLHAGGTLRCLELRDDAGETLGQRVVDFAGQSLPLILCPGLTGLGDQLRMEPGVLVQCLLEALRSFSRL
ncbi:hypothetical protein [Occultella kanbiaonis]|uniref:hypothetical protein n=1 Tax=Occultella kanbiaonis TaxID=2675754 RepID=UPI001F2157B8|nr:hypothetical protein [Occultella kanbiaonis]